MRIDARQCFADLFNDHLGFFAAPGRFVLAVGLAIKGHFGGQSVFAPTHGVTQFDHFAIERQGIDIATSTNHAGEGEHLDVEGAERIASLDDAQNKTRAVANGIGLAFGFIFDGHLVQGLSQ